MLGHSGSAEGLAPFGGSGIDRGLVPMNAYKAKHHLNRSTLSAIPDQSGEEAGVNGNNGAMTLINNEYDNDSILEKIARKNLDRPKKLALSMSLSQPKRVVRRRD